MDKETLIAEFKSIVDEAVTKQVAAIVGKEASEQVTAIVKKMRIDRVMTGKDISGVDDETKIAFVKDVRAISRGEKAALLSNSDQTGGYLIPTELYAGILRVAATVGIVARDARKFSMSSNELEVPRYTGSALQGEYIGEDEEADETAVDFGDSRLLTKTWAVIFRVGNTLLQDASVDLADWLIAIAAEGLSYRLDREGFRGGTFAGSPFVGIFGSADIAAHTMATGSTQFDDFGIAEASDAIGAVPTSVLNNAGFYFHRTVWAKIRARSTSGVFEFAQSQIAINTLRRENGIQPVGEILGYPVFTSDVLPQNSETAVSTLFGFFGDLSSVLLWGDKGPMEIAKSDSATVGGKSLFRANQTAIRLIHRHAIAIGLPNAGVTLKTAAS